MLHVEDLWVSYGDAVALQSVHVEIAQGQIVTIVGTNGAGKTTLINTLAGVLRPRQGRILLDGYDLARVPAHMVCDYGIALVPEGRRLFTGMTVLDNLKIGAYPRHARAAAAQTLEWVFSLFPRLAERRKQLAGTLSGGEQQMVAIGRALMAQPRILLLDEPSLGLAPLIVSHIFATVQAINAQGTAVLLVEQNVQKALSIAHMGYVLDEGHITHSGEPTALLADDSIQQAYLGEIGTAHHKRADYG